MKYKVQWHYRSDYGVLVRGEVVELEPDDAAAFNRDSPGVLVEVKKRGRPPKVKTTAIAKPTKDRKVDGK